MKRYILITTLLFTSLLNARVLSMQESIEKTLQNHPDLKSFELQIRKSKHSYKSAVADYLPQLSLEAEYDPTKTFVLPANGSLETKDEDSWSAGVFLKQKIWDFEKTTSKIKATRYDEDISKLSLKDAQALMVYKVKSLYMQMILQKEAIKVREKDLESKEAYYAQAKALVEQGLKTNADASRFLSSVYAAKDELAIANSIYEQAKTSLSLYMGEMIEDNIELENDLIQQDYSFDRDSINEALQSNYQLQIESQNIDKNMLLHKSAKASHYGSIDGVAYYNHIDNLDDYDSKMVGVVLSVPIYSGGRTTAEEQTAQISTQIAKQAKASQELNLKDELTTLMLEIKRYNSTILAKKSQIDASNETKKVLEARYNEGLATYIEVLDAVTVVLNAELDLLQAYYSKSLAIQRIQYLEGKTQ
jgi:outer membrane protein TolC